MSSQLLLGDCLELMNGIPDGSIDMVLADPPYGTTQCSWDNIIPFEPLWEQYNRICKENAAIVLFSFQPFTTDLIASNRKMFRYEIIWRKTQPMGFLNAKKMPMRAHENICVFYRKLPTYNPIKHTVSGKIYDSLQGKVRKNGGKAEQYNEFRKPDYVYTESKERYPTDVIKFSNWNGVLFGNANKHVKHPTAKPIPLLEYLIKTYTNEGETVLDNCSGVMSTAIAAERTGRNCICIEKDRDYFFMGMQRFFREVNKE